jgi:uncharacterized protein YndB with AHSA1/START domain
VADTFVARASVTINAPRARVWDALVAPEMIGRYLPVTSVTSDWSEGSPIVWKSEFQGKAFEVKGTVLRFEPERVFEYDHSLPIFRPPGGRAPRDRQVVTIELRVGARTEVVVTERNNKNAREFEHSEGSWRMVLNGMKALVEGTSVAPTSPPKLRT